MQSAAGGRNFNAPSTPGPRFAVETRVRNQLRCDAVSAPAMDHSKDVPWRALPVSGRDVNSVPSMITSDESLYLHWLARCRYRGLGEIVDGGPLLGGSTMALAEGLRLNPAVTNRVRRIHSYDLFEYTPAMKRVFKGRAEPPPSSSLLSEFMRHTLPWREQICVYPGDVCQYTWNGAPIEILFIDLAKTWEIQRHLLRTFFPSLIPGVSTVVQQDYFFVSCYWIHLLMEYLHEYFAIAAMPDGPTLAFDYIAPIPRELLDPDDERHFSLDEAVALMDRSLDRFAGSKRLTATTAKVSLLLAYGDVSTAATVLQAVREAPDFDDHVRIDWDKAAQRVHAAAVADRRRRPGGSEPREFAYWKPSWAEGAITQEDARFVHDLVLETRPASAVEIGVASGCSSAVLLQALDIVGDAGAEEPLLYAFDIATHCYFDGNIPTGTAVKEETPDLASRYALTCGDALDASRRLTGMSIEFAFIDGNHYHPWPAIDLIALLPVLAPGAWVALHDIRLPEINIRSLRGYGPGYVYDRWPFEKRQGGFRGNTGAIRLPVAPTDLRGWCDEVLSLPWETVPPARVLEALGINGQHVADSSRIAALHRIERAWRQERPLYVWGTGEAAGQMTAWLRERQAPVAGLVDDDPTQWDRHLWDLVVVAPAAVRTCTDGEPLVVVTGRYRHRIARRLKADGWRADRDFVVL